ncbi:putative reverse transcriptase domain-containing protein [Tanacetum coccineum]
MPPRRWKKESVTRLVEKHVAKAIEEYKRSKANLYSARSSGGNTRNTGGTVNVQSYSHKTFMNGKPHSFDGTKGVVGLKRWIEKVEQVFKTCKCAEEDKIIFAASTFKGRDDIEAYNNRFHELTLMCPELAPTRKKKIERYVLGFPKRIKGNITSSKPTTLYDAINMARELVVQAVQAPAEGRGYAGNLPRCNCFNSQHKGQCPLKCQKCQRTGHQEKDCRVRVPGAGNPNVVAGTFLLNDHYACILFYSGVEKCFVSSSFIPFIDISPIASNTSYEVELADRKVKKKPVKRLVEKHVAKAIEEYERSRANLDSVGSSRGNTENAVGTVNVQSCSHKTFINGKPYLFNGTEGVVGLRRWIEKVEQVFETCKCAEEDKVMFAASTFEGRALTWWNGNVHTLGLVIANRDDIEAYNNRFHELALMCPELVPTEKKKIEKYIRGFLERINGYITFSKPATLHDAINMAIELVEQAVQGRATRIGEKQ